MARQSGKRVKAQVTDLQARGVKGAEGDQVRGGMDIEDDLKSLDFDIQATAADSTSKLGPRLRKWLA
jgi:hypothetical protein